VSAPILDFLGTPIGVGIIVAILIWIIVGTWQKSGGSRGTGDVSAYFKWLKENPRQMIWTLAAVVLLALMASAGRC